MCKGFKTENYPEINKFTLQKMLRKGQGFSQTL